MRYIIFLCILTVGCVSTEWVERFDAEFDFNKPTYRTPINNIPVATPAWLAPEDIPQVLDAIDQHCEWVKELYPWTAENFDFSSYVVWIHESPVAFVAGDDKFHAWAYGWAIGDYMIVSWGVDRGEDGAPCGMCTGNFLRALVHEWFHVILQERYGYADAGHCFWFPGKAVQGTIMMCKLRALMMINLKLSAATSEAFNKYRYEPWVLPFN